MTDLEKIKMSLEGVTPVAWAWKGPKGGFLADDKKPSWDCEPLYSAAALESLQRENEELRQRLDVGPCGEDAIDVAESAADHLRHRAEAAEAKVKRLRERLEPFSRFTGVLFERNFNRTDSVAEMTDVDDIPHVIFAGAFFDARAALASTGGEHHAE